MSEDLISEKEKLFGEHIRPLMKEVLKAARDHGIAFISSFSVEPHPESDCAGGAVLMSTAYAEHDTDQPKELVYALAILEGRLPVEIVEEAYATFISRQHSNLYHRRERCRS